MEEMKRWMEAREKFNMEMGVGVSREEDMRVKGLYEMYFRLEIDELDVGEVENKEGGSEGVMDGGMELDETA